MISGNITTDYYLFLLKTAVINLNYKKIAKLESHLNKLLENTSKLATVVNKALQRLDQLTDFLLMDQTLYVQ